MNRVIRNEAGELTDPPAWFPRLPGVDRIYTVPVMQAGQTAILVTGDADRNRVQTMPGGTSATIEIRLPSNWDSLMAERGYSPLSAFYLEP